MNRIRLDGCDLSPTKVICVGKNYRAHIEEMGGGDVPGEPVIFIKPNSAIVCEVPFVFIPQEYGLLHYEVELCFAAGRRCKSAGVDEAVSCIGGYGVGIDFTLRDRQSAAKSAGGPWSIAKGFDGSAAFGPFVSVAEAGDVLRLNISLGINGTPRQNSNTSRMIFSPPFILSFASRFMTIEEGDVFMCGTPEGVGAIEHGDKILAEIETLPGLSLEIRRE